MPPATPPPDHAAGPEARPGAGLLPPLGAPGVSPPTGAPGTTAPPTGAKPGGGAPGAGGADAGSWAATGLPPGARTAPSGTGGRGSGTKPPDPVATDLSTWRGSPPQMVASLALRAPERVEFAKKVGAVMDISVYPSTYTLTWVPPEGAKGVLVTLHGHGAWAYDALYVWHEFAKARQLAIVSVQWWDTLRESELDYLAPKPLLEVITATVKRHFGDKPPPVVLSGFSRGSAQTYGVAAWDRVSPSPLFSGVLANAGGVEQNYPTTQRINLGEFGNTPFAGMPWVLACSGRDDQPDVSGCPAMERTKGWLEKQGATTRLFTDPDGLHGSFNQNPEQVYEALDLLFPKG